MKSKHPRSASPPQLRSPPPSHPAVGLLGMGTIAPSEGLTAGVSGEVTCAGGASSMSWPSCH
eukprot:7548958-Alexandrium_andersonii.AAC.1